MSEVLKCQVNSRKNRWSLSRTPRLSGAMISNGGSFVGALGEAASCERTAGTGSESKTASQITGMRIAKWRLL